MNKFLEKEMQQSEETRKRILEYIIKYRKMHLYSPSNVEIAKELNIGNSTAKRHIDKLFDMGLLVTDLKDKHNISRAYREATIYTELEIIKKEEHNG